MHLKGNRSLGNVYTASSIFLLLFHTERETDFPFKRGRQQPPDKEEACVKGGRGTRRGGTGQKAEESRWRNEPLDLYINLYVTRRAQHTTYKGTGHRPAIVFGCSSSIMYFSLFQDAIHFFLLHRRFLALRIAAWNRPCPSPLRTCAPIVSRQRLFDGSSFIHIRERGYEAQVFVS